MAAIIATLRVALSQLDQPATTKTRSRRARIRPGGDTTAAGAASTAVADVEPVTTRTARGGPALAPARTRQQPADRRRARHSGGATLTPAMPAGFNWMDATPAPKIRSGFALVVILAVLGALLAVAVAGLVLGAAMAIQGAVS